MKNLKLFYRIGILLAVVLLLSNCDKDLATQVQSDNGSTNLGNDITNTKVPGGPVLSQLHIYCPDGPPGCDYDYETDCCVICEGVNGNCHPEVVITPGDTKSADNSIDLQKIYNDLRGFIQLDEENNTYIDGNVSNFFKSNDWNPLFPYLELYPEHISLLQTGQAKLIAIDCVEKGGEIIISTFIHAVPIDIGVDNFEVGDEYFSIKFVL